MTDGFVLSPGGGDRLGAGGLGVTLKAGARHGASLSVFETVIGPGFDVGAHLHHHAEEFFYVLEGEVDFLAFEPRVRTEGDWQQWESPDGRKVVRGGPGSFMFVPPGCPHAFANPGPGMARLLFQVAPAGHEIYLQELADLVTRGRPFGPDAIAELRRRHDIQQLTPPGGRR